MSVFNSETNQNESNNESNNNENQSFVEALVKSKGENFRDPEVMAKSKIEADTHIASLEEQLAQLREDLGKQDYAKTLLEEMQKKAGETATPNPAPKENSSTNTDDTKSAVSEDDLESLVENFLNKREKRASTEENLKYTNEQLEEIYGTEAEAKVQAKANELGLTKERLQEMAAESPSAFFALMGEKPKTSVNTFNTSSANSEGVRTTERSGERNSAYYSNLRKTNKRQYYTPEVQRQMVKDRMALGDRW